MILSALANMGLRLINFLIGSHRKQGAIPEQSEPGSPLDQLTGPQES